jgi:hypothetical protein
MKVSQESLDVRDQSAVCRRMATEQTLSPVGCLLAYMSHKYTRRLMPRHGAAKVKDEGKAQHTPRVFMKALLPQATLNLLGNSCQAFLSHHGSTYQITVQT